MGERLAGTVRPVPGGAKQLAEEIGRGATAHVRIKSQGVEHAVGIADQEDGQSLERRLAAVILEAMGIEDVSWRSLDELLGGHRQRVGQIPDRRHEDPSLEIWIVGLRQRIEEIDEQ